MDSQLLRSEELGVRLEIVRGLPIWEASPVLRHQQAIDRIRASFKKSETTNCKGIHVSNIYIQFPEGSLKRPDISIFCKRPKARDKAVKEIPEAVIEIISKGYEAKDLEIGVPFYLSQDVKDVVVFNPYTMEVLHFKRKEERKL